MNKKGFSSIELLVVSTLVAVFCWVPLALWTDRSLDFWVSYHKGHPVDVPMWLSAITALFLNGLAFGANVLSEVVRLVIA